jgi:hypothetical protein
LTPKAISRIYFHVLAQVELLNVLLVAVRRKEFITTTTSITIIIATTIITITTTTTTYQSLGLFRYKLLTLFLPSLCPMSLASSALLFVLLEQLRD